MATIAVDFDGVIHGYGRGWQDGAIYDPPVPGAFAGLRSLMAAYAVFVHTSRDPAQVAAWLAAEGGFTCTADPGATRFWDERGKLLVTSAKLPAAAYIDDRAIRFTTWNRALADVGRLEKKRR